MFDDPLPPCDKNHPQEDPDRLDQEPGKKVHGPSDASEGVNGKLSKAGQKEEAATPSLNQKQK